MKPSIFGIHLKLHFIALHFNRCATEGNTFFNDCTKIFNLGDDTEKAGRIFTSIMQAFREIILLEESLQLIPQLLVLLKAAYVNGLPIKKRTPILNEWKTA